MKYLIVIIISILAVGAGVGVAYLLDDSVAEPEVVVDSNVSPKVVQESVEFVASTGEAVDCGRIEYNMANFGSAAQSGGMMGAAESISQDSAEQLACFEKLFNGCKLGSLVQGVPGMAMNKYEVLGSVGNQCLVETSFEKYFDDSFVGPKMSCEYSWDDFFKQKVKGECEGDLYDMLERAGLIY